MEGGRGSVRAGGRTVSHRGTERQRHREFLYKREKGENNMREERGRRTKEKAHAETRRRGVAPQRGRKPHLRKLGGRGSVRAVA